MKKIIIYLMILNLGVSGAFIATMFVGQSDGPAAETITGPLAGLLRGIHGMVPRVIVGVLQGLSLYGTFYNKSINITDSVLSQSVIGGVSGLFDCYGPAFSLSGFMRGFVSHGLGNIITRLVLEEEMKWLQSR